MSAAEAAGAGTAQGGGESVRRRAGRTPFGKTPRGACSAAGGAGGSPRRACRPRVERLAAIRRSISARTHSDPVSAGGPPGSTASSDDPEGPDDSEGPDGTDSSTCVLTNGPRRALPAPLPPVP